MKLTIQHGYHDGRHGVSTIVAGTVAEVDAYFWNDAFEYSYNVDGDVEEDVRDDLAAFKAHFDGDVSEAMAECRPDVSWQTDQTEIDIKLPVPTDPVQAARAAVEALAFARDCLKAAGAVRAADKARLALSSAKGAVRHVENKVVR